MIGVRCDRCGTHFWAKDEVAGRSASCSRCGQILRIPEPPEEDEPPSPQPILGQSPPAEAVEPPSLWIPREPAGDDVAGSLRELLKITRQIRLLLAVLVVLLLICLGMLLLG